MDATIYTIPLMCSAVACIVLALFSWSRRSISGLTYLTFVMLATAVWSLGYAMELSAPDFGMKILMGKVQYLGIAFIPFTWFLFSVQYRGVTRFLKKDAVALFAIIPVITVILVWTNDYHHLYYSSIMLKDIGAVSILNVDYSSWFYVFSVYSYGLLVLGTVNLSATLLRHSTVYKGQASVLIASMSFPWLANALYLMRAPPLYEIDGTPLAFTLTGILLALGLYSFKLLDVVPMARDLVLESMDTGVIVLDGENKVVDINPAGRRMLEGTGPRSDPVGSPIIDVFSDFDGIGEAIEHEDEPTEVATGNGTGKKYFEVHSTAIARGRGRSKGHVLLLTDISERKRTEDALARSKENLEILVKERTQELAKTITELETEMQQRAYAEEKFRYLIENITEGIYTTDADGNITYLSPAVARFTGLDTSSFEGRSFKDFIHPDDLEIAMESFLRAVEGESNKAEFRVIPEPGKVWWMESSAGPLRSGGKFIGLQGVLSDITKRKVAEEELQRYKGHLEELVKDRTSDLTRANQLLSEITEKANTLAVEARSANRAKSEFLANMSHEIRTPMTAILGFTDLLLYTEMSSEQKEKLGLIRKSSESLLEIINDILDLSKIDAGRFEVMMSPFELAPEMDCIVRLMDIKAKEKGLALSLSMDRGLPHSVVGDKQRLRQVLVNIIGNAIKFTESGRVDVSLKMEREGGGGTGVEPGKCVLRFSVRDTGIGISKENLDLIFEPFKQVDGSMTRKYGGTGLGLTISMSLVDLMGGRIWVESAPGQGSVFNFTITFDVPLAGEAGKGTAPVPAKSEGRTSNPKGTLDGARILLVEDNEINRELIQAYLEIKGVKATEAVDGQRAVDIMERERFDIILMDVQMPVMDGTEATRRIRAMEKERGGPHTPIIALTAHVMNGDKERFLADGMDDYVSKPIDRKVLLAKLEEHLASRSREVDREAHTGRDAGENGLPPLLDLKDLDERLDNNHKLAKKLFKMFLEECPTKFDALRASIAKKDLAEVKAIAHNLKGTSLNLSAKRAGAVAAELESAAKAGDLRLVDDCAGRLDSVIKATLEQMLVWVSKAP